MRFKFVAYNLEAGITEGRVEARNLKEARSEVLQQGLKLLTIKQDRKSLKLEELFPSFFKVGRPELIRFSRHLATILLSGGNLLRALDMLTTETQNRVMRTTLESMRKMLDEGESLSATMKEHPKVFSPLYVSVIEVGEYTGQLPPALEEMADMLQREHEAKLRAVRTMMYPAAIIGLALVTLVILLIVAVPPMLKVFSRMGADVPLITRIMMGMLGWFRENVIFIILGLGVIFVALLILRRLPSFKRWSDTLQIRLPVLGPLVLSSELSRISRTIFVLLRAGVPLATALRLSINGCKNQNIKQVFSDAEEGMLSGHGLTSALQKQAVIPNMFVELVMIGEEGNSLQRTMEDIARAYEKQFEQRLNRLVGMVEPISTLTVGGIVAVIAFSMFLPIYSGLNAF